MEVSALKYSGGIGLHGRSPLLRIQSDERLVALVRRGSTAAFETLVARYETRLLSFCRHLLGSREDAEDVLQDVMTAAYNAMRADDRPINVRPWLYRIARNRSLNHLRRSQPVGVDSMDIHLSENGATTADKVHEREEFRLLVGDIHGLPETQRTALVLREMDALSYEQIAEAMETTVPSVKSLLVRARVSLAEAAEARLLTCDDVRIELGEIAEGLLRRPSPLVRRHLKACPRCASFRDQLKQTNRALAALLPVGPLALLRQLAFTHLGHSAGSTAAASTGAAGSGAAATGATSAGAGAGAASAGVAAGAGTAGTGAGMAGAGIAVGSGTGGLVSAGVGAIATKAAAGLAAAALVTAGAVEVGHAHVHHPFARPEAAAAVSRPVTPAPTITLSTTTPAPPPPVTSTDKRRKKAITKTVAHTPTTTTPTTTTTAVAPTTTTPTTTTPPGRTDTTTVPTVLPPSEAGNPPTGTATTPVLTPTTTSTTPSSPGETSTTPMSSTPGSTSTTPTTTTPTSTSTTSTTSTSTPPGATVSPTSTSSTPSGS